MLPETILKGFYAGKLGFFPTSFFQFEFSFLEFLLIFCLETYFTLEKVQKMGAVQVLQDQNKATPMKWFRFIEIYKAIGFN